MAVNDTNTQYDYYSDLWKRCRDANEGQIAIHNAGKKYLARLSGQTDDEFKAYIERTPFYEATGRTVQGLCGTVFRKTPVIESGGMEAYLENVTSTGINLTSLSENATKQVLIVGRVGYLVDYPQAVGVQTRAEQEAMNIRPFVREYKAESIINWRTDIINNMEVLTQVRLSEVVVEYDDTDYTEKEIERVRVLALENNVYSQRIYEKQKGRDKTEWVMIDEIIPTIRGASLSYIPFVFMSQYDNEPDVKNPPLSGLVNMNISHYKTVADLEHGAHYTALPTAYVTGVQSEDGEAQVYRIGSGTAWSFVDPSTKVGFLEFTGQGLGSLKELKDDKEQLMASLGAQMLTPSLRRNESTETAQMRHMGENSVLASLTKAVERGINEILRIMAEWLNVTPATIALNTDFTPAKIDPAMMRELLMALQAGRISQETYFEQLKQGEIIADNIDYDDEISRIQTGLIVDVEV